MLPDLDERRQAYALAERLGLALTELHHPVTDTGSGATRCSCPRLDCGTVGKHPLRSGWAKQPLRHARQMSAVFGRASNLGVVTGATSSCVVLDVDPRNGGDVALDDWEAARADGPLPPTFTVDTPSGGFHLYFRLPEGVDAGQKPFLSGVDVRGRNGLAVFPPSRGANSLAYRVRDGSPTSLAACPPDVEAAVRLQVHLGSPVADALATVAEPGKLVLDARRAALRRVALAPAGQRNTTLNQEAFGIGQLAGHLDLDLAARELVEAALRAGLPVEEAVRTVLRSLCDGVARVDTGLADSLRRTLVEQGVGR